MKNNNQVDRNFFIACSFELGLGCIALLFGVVFGPDPRSDLPQFNDIATMFTGFFYGVVFGILLAGLMLLVQLIPSNSMKTLNDASTAQVLQLLRGMSLAQLVTVALTAGVGEELLFRGWLMQLFTGNVHSCSLQELLLGLCISSLIFGLVHPMSILYIILASVMGIVLGAIYWIFDNLLVSIVTHWIYDAILMVWLVKFYKP